MRKLLVWTSRDGITVVPLVGDAREQSRKRVFLAGGPVTELNGAQVRALIDLTFREPSAHLDGPCIFLDGELWSRQGEQEHEIFRFDLRP